MDHKRDDGAIMAQPRVFFWRTGDDPGVDQSTTGWRAGPKSHGGVGSLFGSSGAGG